MNTILLIGRRSEMDKNVFCDWLQRKVDETLEVKPKDDINHAYILGAATAMNEILRQVNEGDFDGVRYGGKP
jgi:hypothetical protein